LYLSNGAQASTKEHTGIFLNRLSKYGLSTSIIATFSKMLNGNSIQDKSYCSIISFIPEENGQKDKQY
jgi:hypothetical protein